MPTQFEIESTQSAIVYRWKGKTAANANAADRPLRGGRAPQLRFGVNEKASAVGVVKPRLTPKRLMTLRVNDRSVTGIALVAVAG